MRDTAEDLKPLLLALCTYPIPYGGSLTTASTQPDRWRCGKISRQSPRYSVALPMMTGLVMA